MAPSTAVALMVLGGASVLEVRRPSARRTTGVSSLVVLFAAVQLVTFLANLPPALDALLVPAPGTFNGVPTGRTSPLTALGLLAASLSLFFIGVTRGRRALGTAGGSLAFAVCLLIAVVGLGYAFGAPLLYGGPVIPMAFPTALALGCFGVALVGLAPRDSAPLRWFTGSLAQARLLRAFLPVAPIVIVVELLFDQVKGVDRSLYGPFVALASVFGVAGAVFYAARGVSRDLDRADAERERSRRDADQLAAIVASSSDAIYATDPDGIIVAWNGSAERLFGYAPDEVLGHSAQILSRPGAEEPSWVRKDGSPMLVASSESPMHDAEGLVAGASVIVRDVTEQRRTQAALQQREADFRLLAEAMPQIVWVTRPDGWTVYFNQQWMDYTGLTLEESLGHGWNKPFHPEDQQRSWDAWQHATATSGIYSVECRLRRADGAYTWWLIRGVPVRDASGSILKWFGTCTDIHELKVAALEISESHGRFAKVFNSGLVAIGISERSSGRLIDVNVRCTELFGYARDEMIGHTVVELGLWDDPTARGRLVAAIPNDGFTASYTEAALRRKSGEVCHALISMESMTLAGVSEPLIMTSLVDVTERKQLESQFHQAQKMEAVGRLAGGVAHDFNNQLGVIMGYTEILMRQANEEQRGRLEQILKATQHSVGLTRQLLAFSRKQVVDPKVVEINSLLTELEKMLGRLIGEDIDITIVPASDLGQVKVDPGQLEQVVMNLCVNARDAMPDGGTLLIETANAEVSAEYDRAEPMLPGRYVTLSVSDTGCGIEKEVLSKIFEPFFTTKEQGKGTGLGLAMVYGSVKQAGGYVWVHTELGRGTTFKICLPRIDAPRTVTAVETVPMPSKGWETILLVEDEPALRAIVHELLQEHGYRVIEAASANEGIEIARHHPEAIHLLVTDVVMPGLSGRALASSLLAVRPEIRILYMSGYTDDVIAHRGVLQPGILLLTKPFTRVALLRRVRDALAE